MGSVIGSRVARLRLRFVRAAGKAGAVAALAALAATIAAPAAAQTSDPRQNRPIRIDHVVATVNDTAILQSQVLAAALGEIRAQETQLQRKLSPNELDFMLDLQRDNLIRRYAMAQSAKSLGVYPPELIEGLFRDQLRTAEEQQIRDFGSVQKFSQALQRQGRSWAAFEREQRVETMFEIAEELTVWQRLQNQRNLFITPKMMRAHYERMRDRYVHGAVAEVSTIAFLGADAAEKAARAAAAWKEQDLRASEFAQRFGEGAKTLGDHAGLTEKSQSVVDDLLQFAIAGPAGAVKVVPRDDIVQVWKVTAYQPARNGRFEDGWVQDDIRTALQSHVVRKLREEAGRRALDRTFVWVAPN